MKRSGIQDAGWGFPRISSGLRLDVMALNAQPRLKEDALHMGGVNMSYMFEVYYKPPQDPRREAR